MRVLWITNSSSVTTNSVNVKRIGGGWVTSLETEFSKKSDINLGIAFKSNQENISPFKIEGITYYPISFNPIKNRYEELAYRWKHKIESDTLIQMYIDVVNEFKPDIIHIFGTESNYGLIIAKTSVPCIIHLQGSLILVNYKWFSGLSAFEILKYSKKWILLLGYGFFHEYYFFKKAAKREIKIFRECNYFMGRTDWDKRISSILAPNSIYFHSDEIMRQNFYNNKWQPHLLRNDIYITTTTRNCTYKGLETIFDCSKILNDYFTQTRIIWKIAGIKESDEICHIIESKAKAKFVDNDILLLGSLDENELIAIMLEADLYVYTSHIDNSPNSVCEAMLLGMPIIATFAGGIPSILSDKKEGLLVQDGDPYALAGAILELIKNNDYGKNLGANARIRAKKRHDPDFITEKVIDIYTSVLALNNIQ